jgi:hypothetical protein
MVPSWTFGEIPQYKTLGTFKRVFLDKEAFQLTHFTLMDGAIPPKTLASSSPCSSE